MSWKNFKESILKNFESHLKEGRVDKEVLELIKKINSNHMLVTTSSCSGRIVLLEFDLNEGKKTAEFYRKWHRSVSESEIIDAIVNYKSKKPLWFKFEPLILHIAAANVDVAAQFLKKIRAQGIKRGGIQSITKQKVMIEIQGNGQLIFPVLSGTCNWNDIIKIANEMLEKNLKLIRKLEKVEW